MSLDSNPLRVLVIEDDDLSRELLKMLLASGTYSVRTVESGDAALRLLRTNESSLPKVVLCDLRMPGTSGPALAHQLRGLCGPSARLLAMSGTRVQAREWSGFDAFLLKPFAVEEFVAASAPPPAALRPPVDENTPAVTPVAAKQQSPAPPALNQTTYRQLADSMQPAQVDQLYALCLSDTESHIANMRRAAVEGDDLAFRREAHTVKGSCSMVGAAELQTIADKLESQGLAANHVASLDEMVLACERLRGMLVAHSKATTGQTVEDQPGMENVGR